MLVWSVACFCFELLLALHLISLVYCAGSFHWKFCVKLLFDIALNVLHQQLWLINYWNAIFSENCCWLKSKCISIVIILIIIVIYLNLIQIRGNTKREIYDFRGTKSNGPTAGTEQSYQRPFMLVLRVLRRLFSPMLLC